METPVHEHPAQHRTKARHLMPRICLAAALVTLLGAGIIYRLGLGRFYGSYYIFLLATIWCCLLALLLGIASIIAWQPEYRLSKWLTRLSGPLIALFIFLSLYETAQLACRWFGSSDTKFRVYEGDHASAVNYTFDPDLGWAPLENVASGARLTVRDQLIFDYSYQTDGHRRRVVPAQSIENVPRERALLFFGGSYVFGEAVNDSETLPNQLALLEPDTRMYNYGFSGYGPGQMLARMESRDLRPEIDEAQVAAIYVFIPNHVRRVIGSYSVITWSRHSPYYQLAENGDVFRVGNFQNQRSRLTGWYDFLRGDHVLQHFKIDIPPRVGSRHFELTAAILDAARKCFEFQFGSTDFSVLIYPDCPSGEFSGRDIVPTLQERGIRVLDYSDLFGTDASHYFYLPHDTHPTPEAHRMVAAQLSREALFSGGDN